jgi:Chain length determinant protein
MNKPNNDEIDLFELAKEFWRQKLAAISIIVSCCIGGVGYAILTPQIFTVTSQAKVQEKVIAYVNSNRYFCSNDSACWTKKSLEPLINNLDPKWAVSDSGYISLKTSDPLPISAYAAELAEAAFMTKQDILNSAELELKLIDNLFGTEAINLDSIAIQRINAARIIALIEAKVDLVNVSEPEISKISPIMKIIIARSLLIGLFLSAVFISIRYVTRIRTHSQNMTVAARAQADRNRSAQRS